LANVPLRAAYQAALPQDARGNGMSVTNLLIYTCTTLLSVFMLLLARLPPFESVLNQLLFLAGLSGAASALAGWHWRREVWELVSGTGQKDIAPERKPALATVEKIAHSGEMLPDRPCEDGSVRPSDMPSALH